MERLKTPAVLRAENDEARRVRIVALAKTMQPRFPDFSEDELVALVTALGAAHFTPLAPDRPANK